MNLTAFIDKFHSKDYGLPKLDKVKYWIHKHPTLLKTIQIACIIFGSLAILSTPFSWALLGASAIVLPVAGTLLVTLNALALKFLDIYIGPHHSMKSHVFKPGSYSVGKLYYQGDIPILELQADDPYKTGEAHGFLLAPSIHKIFTRLQFLFKLGRQPLANDLPFLMKKIQEMIPEEYLKELQGIVDGYNKWGQSKFIKVPKMSFDDLLLLHLLPDQIHFNLKETEDHLSDSMGFACTAIIDKDEKDGIIFGRNMDWRSYGIFGTQSLLINYKFSDHRHSLIGLGPPGIAGILTGMNKNGLSLAMNVCSSYDLESIEGMPALFYNRKCLETCKVVEEVNQLVEKHFPLAAYHLTVADTKSAQAFHLLQGEGNQHVLRELFEEKPLIVTNFNYPEEDKTTGRRFRSPQRDKIIQNLFFNAKDQIPLADLDKNLLVKAALKLPFVNNFMTIHSVLMKPLKKEISISVDNGFAADDPLIHVDTTQCFAT